MLSMVSFPCLALYECSEHGRIILSSAPCDTTWTPLARYGVGVVGSHSASSITLSLNSSNSYVISGTVQGKSAQFVIDTGASRTAISARMAAAAGLMSCKDSVVSHTANGVVRTCEMVASEIVFGSFRMVDIHMLVLPNMTQDVLLGMDVLRQLKIDQRNGHMTLSR